MRHYKALDCELSIMRFPSPLRAIPPDCYSEDLHRMVSTIYTTVDRVVITTTSTLYHKIIWSCSRRIIVTAKCSPARKVFRLDSYDIQRMETKISLRRFRLSVHSNDHCRNATALFDNSLCHKLTNEKNTPTVSDSKRRYRRTARSNSSAMPELLNYGIHFSRRHKSLRHYHRHHRDQHSNYNHIRRNPVPLATFSLLSH